MNPVAERLEIVEGHLLHLVRGVAAREVLAQEVALDRVGEDDRGRPRELGRRLVRGVDLVEVVSCKAKNQPQDDTDCQAPLQCQSVESHNNLHIFIDEIQLSIAVSNPYVDSKEKNVTFVDVLLGFMKHSNLDIYVTGSNSKMPQLLYPAL